VRRYRKYWIVAAAFLALSLVLSIIDGLEWRNTGVVVGLLAVGFQLYWPRRLRERIRQLSADGETAGS
jgi:hypothetical protein